MTATPTRLWPLAWFLRESRAWYLRMRIRQAERDEAMHKWHAAREPGLAAEAAGFAEQLRVELAAL